MYLAGVSVRRVEDITEALWGSKVSPATISELNKKAYVHIEDWRNRPLQGGRYPYVYVDGIYLRRNWGGEYENVAILVAIAVNEDGYREVLGAAEGMKEDKASWVNFFQWLRSRGLDGVKLIDRMSFGKEIEKGKKASIHAGLRRDGSQQAKQRNAHFRQEPTTTHCNSRENVGQRHILPFFMPAVRKGERIHAQRGNCGPAIAVGAVPIPEPSLQGSG